MSYAPDHARIATPIGMITICGTADSLSAITIESGIGEGEVQSRVPAVMAAVAQLRAYFDGRLQHFDLPLLPLTTPRGEALRAGIAAIGYGETMSYGALAASIGSSPRAIGQACARNPYPIIIPCHRVLGAGGALGAYSAGAGSDTKQQLLIHENPNFAKGTLWAL